MIAAGADLAANHLHPARWTLLEDAASARARPGVTEREAGPISIGMTDEPINPPRVLTPAAQRALAEAEARRAARAEAEMAVEHGGPTGPEPTRYGDWEKKGLAVDF